MTNLDKELVMNYILYKELYGERFLSQSPESSLHSYQQEWVHA